MGSLASRPKAPTVPPAPVIEYVQIPAAAPPSQPVVSAPPPASASAPEPTDDEVKERSREANLLERRRGRLSTVLTSFRGLLNDTLNATPRKTLLGE